jgi:hypothetical protein
MRKNPRRILSPQRLPFRHPGDWHYKLNESKDLVQLSATLPYCSHTLRGSGTRGDLAACRQVLYLGEKYSFSAIA